MRNRIQWYAPMMIALLMALLCAAFLMIYVSPMKDVSMDLSLVPQEDGLVINPDKFDSKGWTVYTQEGDIRTELDPNGFGGYSGLELGQTFYLSRVMEEDLDSPTLQLATLEWQFSVWLDDTLIYTDCPELDNRIGHLRLPVNDRYRDDPITISLPADYLGKTLTIAQSFPEWSETSRVMAWPTSVRLYCGYAYESGLISETAQTTLLAAVVFLVVMILLGAFVRSRDWGILCLAAVAIFWMIELLMGTSFRYRYFSTASNTMGSLPALVSALALLCFLTLRGGKHRRILWIPMAGYALTVIGHIVVYGLVPYFPARYSVIAVLADFVPYWFAFIGLGAVLMMGTVWWRKENWFYRVFAPLAFAGIAVSWAVEIIRWKGMVWQQIVNNLSSGQILYVYTNTFSGIIAAALFTAVMDAVRTELNRRAEQHLIEQRNELAMSSYENLRRQHEEVMMIRHDMLRHFHTLHDMGGDDKRTAYLAELIGQNQKIRPVVESGNEMLDIILNGKLGAAVDAGIRVEVPRVEAPARLRLSDPDLCALVMNIVDNAVSAASNTESPYIELRIHEKAGYLAFFCENSFDPQAAKEEVKKETVPKHGLGLKIIRNIVEKYKGVILEEATDSAFTVEIVIPLS